MNDFASTPELILLPAVDVADGKAVRLTQGKAGTETNYGDPVDAAAWDEAITSIALLLAPATPHIAEELWERTGHDYSFHLQPWPKSDDALARDDQVEIAVQVNGKVRDRITLPLDASEDAARARALSSEDVTRHIAGKEIARLIYVPNRLLNIIVKG